VDKNLVYGVAGGGLVFIPEPRARELANTWDALDSCTTWREFRARVPPRRYEALLRQLGYGPRKVDEPPPPDDEAFEGRDLPCVADGDYPEWAAQEMLHWVPREILTAPYSTITPSFLNGPCLMLDPKFEPAIVEAFRAAGFRCTRDEAFVWHACGAGPPEQEVDPEEP
jgi:hypothetical protein